jgi:transcriptional regulator with XRE-family HTH domain
MWWEIMKNPTDQLQPCEIWLPASLPRILHSRLYALEPQGVGTPYVESLTSYIARLSDAHSISVRNLLQCELLPCLERSRIANPSNSVDYFWSDAARALNGIGLLAEEWTQALQQLTLRNDLRCLTFLPWAETLTPQRLLKFHRAWCPECYLDWRTDGQPIYEPLLWSASVVSLCPRHRRQLVQVCPYSDCQAKSPIFTSRFRPGYCTKCSRWLGVVDQSCVFFDDEQNWRIYAARSIGDLLANNINAQRKPHLKNIPRVIRACRVRYGSAQKLSQKLYLSNRTLNTWLLGKQIPQVESLIRVCYFCGISLYDLLTADPTKLDLKTLKLRVLPEIFDPAKERRDRIEMNTEFLQRKLVEVLDANEEPPPSMRQIARRLNYSPRELREHFPDLNRVICERRRQYRRICCEQKQLKLKSEIRQAILEIHAQGLYPSTGKVALMLGKPSLMRNIVFAEFRREVLEELERKND